MPVPCPTYFDFNHITAFDLMSIFKTSLKQKWDQFLSRGRDVVILSMQIIVSKVKAKNKLKQYERQKRKKTHRWQSLHEGIFSIPCYSLRFLFKSAFQRWQSKARETEASPSASSDIVPAFTHPGSTCQNLRGEIQRAARNLQSTMITIL